MPRKKKEEMTLAQSIRSLLVRRPAITAEEAIAELKRTGWQFDDEKKAKQRFYTERSIWRKKNGKAAAEPATAGVPQKRRKKVRRQRQQVQQPQPIDDATVELELLRRENAKLKDMLMRSLM